MQDSKLTGEAPGGLLFPDKATIFLAAIEDQDYKDEKINCMATLSLLLCSPYEFRFQTSMISSCPLRKMSKLIDRLGRRVRL